MDLNVPEFDAKILYNLVITNHYTKALEIGTLRGYSAMWIARALSKTGGTLITIEIHEGRYRQALANFKAAGLSSYIDARLADAHDLVKELTGPFDFVFCDADKNWYNSAGGVRSILLTSPPTHLTPPSQPCPSDSPSAPF